MWNNAPSAIGDKSLTRLIRRIVSVSVSDEIPSDTAGGISLNSYMVPFTSAQVYLLTYVLTLTLTYVILFSRNRSDLGRETSFSRLAAE